jgi:Spy/CpxP family protein refolding chaperone
MLRFVTKAYSPEKQFSGKCPMIGLDVIGEQLMKKLFIILLPALFMSAMACHRSKESRVDFVKGRISSQLDLNEDQEAKLTDLANAVKEQMKEKRDVPTEEFKALIEAPVLNPEQSKAFFDKRKSEMEARADTIYAALFPKLAVFHDSLTDEQRKKVVALMDKFHKRWQKD